LIVPNAALFILPVYALNIQRYYMEQTTLPNLLPPDLTGA